MNLSPNELFAPFAADKAVSAGGIVTLAVSGGSDSLAMLLLAHGWTQTADLTLHAVTVDHGLRPEAAAEAAFVAGLCEGLGIDHTTLGWEGIKPFSGIAEAARRARYALIAEFAAAIGSELILVAHTADDQAETVFMRLAREKHAAAHRPDWGNISTPVSLGRGLAGMAPAGLLPGGVRIGRPLLGVTRAQLRRYLASVPQSWIEDPTNEDVSFERVRVRKAIGDDHGMRQRLTGFASAMGRFRAVLARDAARLLADTVFVQPGPVFLFDLADRDHAPLPVRLFALQVLIALAGGAEYLVPRDRVEPILAWLQSPQPAKTTIGGAVVEKMPGGFRLYREMRNLESLDVEPGEALVWDGRLEIVNNGRETIHVGPLSRAGLERLEDERALRIAARPRAALTSTALIRKGRHAWLPLVEADDGYGQVQTRMTARAIEHFCPQSDFSVLEWLHALEVERRSCLLPRP